MNAIVANAIRNTSRRSIARNALDVQQQRKNDEDWRKFEAQAEKVIAEAQIHKKELKDCENMIAACYAKVKPIFDRAVKFGHDQKQFCIAGRPLLTKELTDDDRYVRKADAILDRLYEEVRQAVLDAGDAARQKGYDLTNLPRPFYN